MEKSALVFASALLLGACAPVAEAPPLDLIPRPASWNPSQNTCAISGEWDVQVAEEWEEERSFWSDWLTADSAGTEGKAVSVIIEESPVMEPEAYALAIRPEGIRIEAGSTSGAFHALTQSPTATSAPIFLTRNGSVSVACRRMVLHPRSIRLMRPGVPCAPGCPISCQAASRCSSQPSNTSGITANGIAPRWFLRSNGCALRQHVPAPHRYRRAD